jgi:hypothetical protein
MTIKRIVLLALCLLAVVAISPVFNDGVDGGRILTAQELPCDGDCGGGDGGGGGCQQTCSPMPAGCGSGYFSCDALTQCVSCSCTTNPVTRQRECTEVTRYPTQKTP